MTGNPTRRQRLRYQALNSRTRSSSLTHATTQDSRPKSCARRSQRHQPRSLHGIPTAVDVLVGLWRSTCAVPRRRVSPVLSSDGPRKRETKKARRKRNKINTLKDHERLKTTTDREQPEQRTRHVPVHAIYVWLQFLIEILT